MGLASAQFSYFTLLTIATFAKCSANHVAQNESLHDFSVLHSAQDEILAGEDTPVWLARRHYTYNTIFYERITYPCASTPSIVKQSMDYWDSIKDKDGFSVGRKPKFERKNVLASGETNFSLPVNSPSNRCKVERDSGNDSSIPSDRITKENIVEDEVLYPSVLVVMDYQDVHPIADEPEQWLVREKIIYALAFWETVARSLRKIRNPRVSLRIAGIVVSTTRQASPYLKENTGEETLINAFPKMLKHWKNVGEYNSDFPSGSYDIVAHMTDIDLQPPCKECASKLDQTVLFIASKGHPCNLPNKIAGIIIHDDFAFKGLWSTISLMPNVLGSRASSTIYDRSKWDEEALDHISTALRNASCMSEPKGRFGPGKPVVPILAGELFPHVKQCEVAGYKTDAWTCWHGNTSHHRSSCLHLACSDHHNRHDHCSKIGRTLDGTFCDENNTMVCLDGDCVKKD